MFLSNHPNSVPVLQAAWHCASQSQNVRGLVLHAMAEWYLRGEPHDQARLSRILDVAQDLKVHFNDILVPATVHILFTVVSYDCEHLVFCSK